MPMYPYHLPTKVGTDWAFDRESNISPHLPPRTVCSLHYPSPVTKSTGRALIFNPVLTAGVNGLVSFNGDIIGLEEIAPLIGKEISPGCFMGNPVYSNDLHGKKVDYVYIPGLAIPVPIIVALIIGISLILGVLLLNVPEEIRRYHELDLALQSQEIVAREYLDVDTGETQSEPFEGADIERIFYKNGDIHLIALNQTGYDWLGATSTTEREGIDWEELLEKLEKEWSTGKLIEYAIIGIVAVGGIVVLSQVLKKQPKYHISSQQ